MKFFEFLANVNILFLCKWLIAVCAVFSNDFAQIIIAHQNTGYRIRIFSVPVIQIVILSIGITTLV